MEKRYVKEHAVESWPYNHEPRTPNGIVRYFLQKKSNYSKIGKLYRLCQIKEKVIGESAKYYEALF